MECRSAFALAARCSGNLLSGRVQQHLVKSHFTTQYPLAGYCKVPVCFCRAVRQFVNGFSFCSLWRKNNNINQHHFLQKLMEMLCKEKSKLERKKLKASTCISTAYCILVQPCRFPAASGVRRACFRLRHKHPEVPRRSAFCRTRPAGGRSSRWQTKWSSRKMTSPVHSQTQGEPQTWALSTATEA